MTSFGPNHYAINSWGAVNQDSSGHPAYDSHNLSSTTDVTTGQTVCAYSNNMSDANYTITTGGQAQDEGGANAILYGKSTTESARTTAAGSFCFDNRSPSGSGRDLEYSAYAIHGDFA